MTPPHGHYGAWSGVLHAAASSKEIRDPIEHKDEKKGISGTPDGFWAPAVLSLKKERLPQLPPLYFLQSNPVERHY